MAKKSKGEALMTGLCSVICVSYNHARFAAFGLRSIYDQSYRNIEIIVLDDGSTDNSVEVIEETLKESPFPTRFIKQKNTGNVPKNFNIALAAARGEYVTMMSLDDLLMKSCISNAVSILSSDQKITFAANSGHVEIDQDGLLLTDEIHLPKLDNFPKSIEDLINLEYDLFGSFYIQGQVFRLDAINAIGGFDEDQTGDDIILRTKLFLYMDKHSDLKYSLGNEVVLAYRKHSQNLHRNALRQIQTITQWKEAYFPDRAYPDLFYRMIHGFVKRSIREGRFDDITAASRLSVDVSEIIGVQLSTTKYRLKMFFKKAKLFLSCAN